MPSGYGKWSGENSGGGRVAGVVAVAGAGVAGAVWLVRELMRAWVELAIIGGGTLLFVGTFVVWCGVQARRGSLPVNEAAKAEAVARARAVPPRPAVAAPAQVTIHSEVHHHYDERQLHVHAAAEPAREAAAVEAAPVRREIAPRVVLGKVLARRDEARLRP